MSRTVYVTAASLEQARDIITSLYREEKIVLDADDYYSDGIADVEVTDEPLPEGCNVYTITDAPDVID